MKKIKATLLGAGSGFTRGLFVDILSIEGIDGGTLGMVDIDERRLDISVRLMERVLDLMGKKKNWKIQASTDRRKVLRGTDYLISTIEVSGVKCVKHDNDIPLKYGIDQCIGDTIGPGGIMKALRTLPPFLEILKDAKKLCPNALVMNYTNPMSIMSLGATRSTEQPFVGLCHSVQGSSRHMANIAGVPYEEMAWKCGGINHMAWFTELSWKGQDLYPIILSNIDKPEVYERDPVRFEMMRELGYFVTESSGHFSEYVPYFRKRKDILKKYCRDGYRGGSGFYSSCWPGWRKGVDQRRLKIIAGKQEVKTARGHEYASQIIEAHALDRQELIYASVPNTGLIPNLPQTGVVEVPVTVDKRGFSPNYFGNLPEQVAALCRSNMAVFELCVSGVLNEDRESVIQSMIMDPLSAAVCCPAEIRSMADELFRAERSFVPEWLNQRPAKKWYGEDATKIRKMIREAKLQKKKELADGAEEVSEMAARNVAAKK